MLIKYKLHIKTQSIKANKIIRTYKLQEPDIGNKFKEKIGEKIEIKT